MEPSTVKKRGKFRDYKFLVKFTDNTILELKYEDIRNSKEFNQFLQKDEKIAKFFLKNRNITKEDYFKIEQPILFQRLQEKQAKESKSQSNVVEKETSSDNVVN